MITYAKYILTSDFPHFLVTLTSVAMVFVIGLIVLALFHRQEGRNLFWKLVYMFTVINVVLWAFVLY
jgi:ABC-type sugar transport system permease subunit